MFYSDLARLLAGTGIGRCPGSTNLAPAFRYPGVHRIHKDYVNRKDIDLMGSFVIRSLENPDFEGALCAPES